MKLAAGCLADEGIAECEGWTLILGEFKEEIRRKALAKASWLLCMTYSLWRLNITHVKVVVFLPQTPVRFTRILVPLLQKVRVSFSYNPRHTDVGLCWLCGAWSYIGLMVLMDINGEGSPHAERQASWAAPLPQHQSCIHFLEKCETARKSCLEIHATSEECLTARKDPSCRRFTFCHAESKRWMLHRWRFPDTTTQKIFSTSREQGLV